MGESEGEGSFPHRRPYRSKELTTFFWSSPLRLTYTARQSSLVKFWQLIGGPLAAGAPPMVQPAQWLIRPWTSTENFTEIVPRGTLRRGCGLNARGVGKYSDFAYRRHRGGMQTRSSDENTVRLSVRQTREL